MLKLFRQTIFRSPSTNRFPAVLAERTEGFRGRPVVDFSRCTEPGKVADACPTNAITVTREAGGTEVMSVDYGHCLFCGACEDAFPDVVHLTDESLLANADRAALITRARFDTGGNGERQFAGIVTEAAAGVGSIEEIGSRLSRKIRRVFGRSLHIREVDAGSCNGCEIEVTALSNPVYDIERFGIHFVASPRHADMLLVTGPVTHNMEPALRQTYEATPGPKIVVAVGACGIGGGIFGKSYASCGGVNNVVPVDVYIPGCPPQPEALLHGLLTALDRFPRK